MNALRYGAASALLLALTAPAFAQPQPTAGNLEKLSNFQQTGTVEPAHIPQTGPKADAIKRNLAKIKLPRGFKISLYALVPDARHIAVGPQGIVTFVGTRKSKVWSVTDRAKARVADEVKEFAPSIAFKIPNGVCFSRDGFLFIAASGPTTSSTSRSASPSTCSRRRKWTSTRRKASAVSYA